MSNRFLGTLVLAWLVALTAGVVHLVRQPVQSADSQAGRGEFTELSVERLNIVEPNGRFRLVLANSARFPGLFMEGKEYQHHSRQGGGMLFFNDDGDEAGGLSISSRREGDQVYAGSQIMFDQYKQDQTVGLVYSERNGQRQAGMRVWDRPDTSIEPLMVMSDQIAKASDDEERARLRQEMMDYAMAHGGVGAERFFAGKVLDDAIVRLADKEGRPRLQLRVDADGVPRVEFLDEAGVVVRQVGID